MTRKEWLENKSLCTHDEIVKVLKWVEENDDGNGIFEENGIEACGTASIPETQAFINLDENGISVFCDEENGLAFGDSDAPYGLADVNAEASNEEIRALLNLDHWLKTKLKELA